MLYAHPLSKIEDEGGSISENKIDEIKAIAQQYDIGTCVQCATAIKAYLKANKIRGRQIRVETNSAQGLLGIIDDDGTNQQVANNGYHEAIVIEVEGVETVFDNIYADGKPLEDWLIDLVVISGNRLIIITKEEF